MTHLIKMIVSLAGNYTPSYSERMWYGEITGKICKIASDPIQIRHMTAVLAGDVRFMSLMGDSTPIEPLTGIGRHPFSNVGCALEKRRHSLFDTSYLKIADFCQRAKPSRSFFVDMGCGIYDESDDQPKDRFSSIPFFSKMYSKSCVSFDKIFAWEAHPYPMWWSKVPAAMRESIRFQNKKVNAGQMLNLLSQFQATDFVVVKLDIDHLQTETKILKVLNDHAHLIDELFFEYHYYFDGLDFGWGHVAPMWKHNATSAIRIMTHFRQRGVRAHFWI